MSKNDGGPAFPTHPNPRDPKPWNGGMTLRQYYAGQALLAVRMLTETRGESDPFEWMDNRMWDTSDPADMAELDEAQDARDAWESKSQPTDSEIARRCVSIADALIAELAK